MSHKYNPNQYCILVNSKEGWQLGYFNNSNIITSIEDKVLCTTNDMFGKCRYFTEVIEIVSNDSYNVGEHVIHKGSQYFVIEIEKIIDSEAYRVILGK